MAERYIRLFTLPENLYQKGSPVIIAAGALLKDNQTGKVLVQLKLKSIIDMEIKAVKVSIMPVDTVGRSLGDSVHAQYLDLSILRDDEFGQRKPIPLGDNTARGFSVVVDEVDFADNSVWTSDGTAWESIPKAKPLSDLFNDIEMRKQYRIHYGQDCAFIPEEAKDFWYCMCGALNRKDEMNCHKCGKSFKDLQALDMDELKKEKDARLVKETAEKRKAEKEKEVKAKANKKKVVKLALIIIPIVAVIIAFLIFFNKVIIPNNQYNSAIALMNDSKYKEAIAAFDALDGYKDSEKQIQTILHSKDYWKTLSFGDKILFGSYEQDNNKTNGKEEIEWLILDKKKDTILVISRYALDCRKYNNTQENVTWETCELRSWLNDSFLNEAFTKTEKGSIPTVKNSTWKNLKYNTMGGNETQDQVFLLSLQEMDEYFHLLKRWKDYDGNDYLENEDKEMGGSKEAITSPTKYAKAQGVRQKSGVHDATGEESCAWWLRSPGIDYDNTAVGSYIGSPDTFGCSVDSDYIAVRPALWINLAS